PVGEDREDQEDRREHDQRPDHPAMTPLGACRLVRSSRISAAARRTLGRFQPHPSIVGRALGRPVPGVLSATGVLGSAGRCQYAVEACPPFGGSRAPISQNTGKTIPIRNMTQWPFLMAMIPRVTSRMK